MFCGEKYSPGLHENSKGFYYSDLNGVTNLYGFEENKNFLCKISLPQNANISSVGEERKIYKSDKIIISEHYRPTMTLPYNVLDCSNMGHFLSIVKEFKLYRNPLYTEVVIKNDCYAKFIIEHITSDIEHHYYWNIVDIICKHGRTDLLDSIYGNDTIAFKYSAKSLDNTNHPKKILQWFHDRPQFDMRYTNELFDNASEENLIEILYWFYGHPEYAVSYNCVIETACRKGYAKVMTWFFNHPKIKYDATLMYNLAKSCRQDNITKWFARHYSYYGFR